MSILGKFDFKKIFNVNSVQPKDLLNPTKIASKLKDQMVIQLEQKFGSSIKDAKSLMSARDSWGKVSEVMSEQGKELTSKLQQSVTSFAQTQKKKLLKKVFK
jgi:hypothetical protein